MLNTLCTISCPLLYFFCKFRWYRSVARGVLKISQTIDRLVAYRIESYICIEFIEQKNLTEPLLQNAHCSNCTLYYIHPRTCMILRYDELPRLDQLYPYCGSIFFQPFANTIVLPHVGKYDRADDRPKLAMLAANVGYQYWTDDRSRLGW